MTSNWLQLYLFYAWPLRDWSCTCSMHDLKLYLFYAWPLPHWNCTSSTHDLCLTETVPVLSMTSNWLELYLFYTWPLTDWSCTCSAHNLYESGQSHPVVRLVLQELLKVKHGRLVVVLPTPPFILFLATKNADNCLRIIISRQIIKRKWLGWLPECQVCHHDGRFLVVLVIPNN
jgi:hypothetical protein